MKQRATNLLLAATASVLSLVGMVGICWLWFGRAPILVIEQPNRVLPPSDGSDRTPPRVSFPIRNGGTAPLVIERIATSCGCVVVTPPKGLLEPGEESFVEATALRPPVGTRTVTLTIFSNSAGRPTTQLHITGFGEKFLGSSGLRQLKLPNNLCGFGNSKATCLSSNLICWAKRRVHTNQGSRKGLTRCVRALRNRHRQERIEV